MKDVKPLIALCQVSRMLMAHLVANIFLHLPSLKDRLDMYDRAKYVFWDAYHPTKAAKLVIAEKLLDGDRLVC